MKITEPVYTERQLVERLGFELSTWKRRRKRGAVRYYRLGSSIYYGESHIREYLSGAEITRHQIEGILSCMRAGHNPFEITDSEYCESGNRHFIGTGWLKWHRAANCGP